jgi:diguanylate cyclase (GGDEF)-like protein
MSSPERPPAPDDRSDASFQIALDCYLASITAIAETVAVIYPEIGEACQDQLTRLRARIEFNPSAKTLEESRDTLLQALQAFGAGADRHTRSLSDELSGALALVARNEDSRTARDVGYVEHLFDFVDQMEKAVTSRDLSTLAGQAVRLRGFAESIELDSRDAFAQLRDQIRDFQHQLREAELLASRDALTGVANRREFERQLAARIESQREFCVLLFDLDGLGTVNDRFGHLCGDGILKQVSERLSTQVRTRDFVCRWGGDEFVVILDCGLEPGLARSRQIAQWLNGHYQVTVEGREMMVNMSVSVGVAERNAGETWEQMFQRVDESMYRQKNAPPAS